MNGTFRTCPDCGRLLLTNDGEMQKHDCEPITFNLEPESSADGPGAGVDAGWLVLWSGKPGPAHAVRVARLHEDDGSFQIVPNGDAMPITVVDDS